MNSDARNWLYALGFLLFFPFWMNASSCDAKAEQESQDTVMPDFTLHPINVSACDDIPANRQWAYSTYFINKTNFTVSNVLTPEVKPRQLSRGFLMYGGKTVTGGDVLDDLWLFDITNQDHGLCPWIKLENGLLDAPHYGGRMIYRAGSDSVVILGGYAKKFNGTIESTPDVFEFDLGQGLSLGSVAVNRAAYRLNPGDSFYHLQGDAGKDDSDDGIYETDICGNQQPEACYDESNCDPLYGNNLNPCQPYTCANGNYQNNYGVYGACMTSLTCTLGAAEKTITKNPGGLALFSAIYNPLNENLRIMGGTGGCKSDTPSNCNSWDSFFPYYENQHLSPDRIYLKPPFYFDESGLTLLHNPNLAFLTFGSGSTAINNDVKMLYEESEASDDWLDRHWPEEASLGVYKVSGALSGIEWDIKQDQYITNLGQQSSVLVGGSFKQTLPPEWYFSLDGGDTFGICGPQGNMREQIIPGMDFYSSKWFGFYEKHEAGVGDYFHSIDTIVSATTGQLVLHPVQSDNHQATNQFDFRLTGAEVAPLVFTKNGRVHNDFLVVGGRDTNGNLLQEPVHFGSDLTTGATYVRKAPNVGPREGAVHIWDPVERTNYIFGGSRDVITYKLSLNDPGLDINKGKYVIKEADFTYKVDDAGTPSSGDDLWTHRAEFDLKYVCDTEGCFTDQISFHFPNINVEANVNNVEINITLPDETEVCGPPPAADPRVLPKTTDWCHILNVPFNIQKTEEITAKSYVADYKLPRPVGDGEKLKVTVTFTPDIIIPASLSFNYVEGTGFIQFQSGAGAVKTNGYYSSLPVVVAQSFDPLNMAEDVAKAWKTFTSNSPAFVAKTIFDLPAGYLGVAPGRPDGSHTVYTRDNSAENRGYSILILQNGAPIKTMTTPNVDGGLTTVHIYGHSLAPGVADLRTLYLDAPPITGGVLNKSSLEYDLQRYAQTLGEMPVKDVHVYHLAEAIADETRMGSNFRGGIIAVMGFDLDGAYVDHELQGDRSFNLSAVTFHELCHLWFHDVVNTDSWLEESICTWASVNSDADPDGFAGYLKEWVDTMNEAIQHTFLSCAIQPESGGSWWFQFGSVYGEGPFVINQFFMALQGLGRADLATQDDVWAYWRDHFLIPNRNRDVDTAQVKSFVDTLLPPFVVGHDSYEGFYRDNVYYGCYHVPLLSIRDFSYAQNKNYSADTPEAWNTAGTGNREYTVEQVHVKSLGSAYSSRMSNISYTPFYMSCEAHAEVDADSASPLPPDFTGCHQITTLKGNKQTFPIQYTGSTVPAMPMKVELLQLDQLIDADYLAMQRPDNAQTFCGAYNQTMTAADGTAVDCVSDSDGDGFKTAEDCNGSIKNFDGDALVNPNAVEVADVNANPNMLDMDCNCYAAGAEDPDGIRPLLKTCE